MVEGWNHAVRHGASRPANVVFILSLESFRRRAWSPRTHAGNVRDLAVRLMVVDSRMWKQAASNRRCPGCGRLPLRGAILFHSRMAERSLEPDLVGGWRQGVLRVQPWRRHGPVAAGGGRDGAPSENRCQSHRGWGFPPPCFLRTAQSWPTKGGRVSNVWRVPILVDRPATWADAER